MIDAGTGRGANRSRRQALEWLVACLGSLGLFMLGWSTSDWNPFEVAILTLAAIIVALSPTRLQGVRLPISMAALILVPTWIRAGPVVSLGIIWLMELVASIVRRPVRLALPDQLLAATLGLGCAFLLDRLASGVGLEGWQLDLSRALAVCLGLWVGQTAVEWRVHGRAEAQAGGWLGLLTNLVLLAPGVLLVWIANENDPLPFAISVTLAVVMLILVQVLSSSQARAFELSTEAASSGEERQRLEAIVDQAPEAIFTVDEVGNLRWLNRTAAEWLGEQQPETLLGRPVSEILAMASSGGVALDHLALLTRASRDGRPVHEEGVLLAPSTAPARLVVSYSPADQDDGGGGLILMRDAGPLTESLLEQEKLAVHLSHELRAPLTTILGYAQLMANPSTANAFPDGQAEFARRISESGDYMLRLVNNLLDLGRLAGDVDENLPLSAVDVVELTQQMVEAHRPQALAKTLDLTFDRPEQPCVMTTSDLALRQILTNLLANAIKYTPANGHVRVMLRLEPQAAVWDVVDDGIGIAPEEQEQLFTRFFRSQRPEARQSKGTGLGLALARAVVDRLGGEISVKSALHQGSTFTVRLPR